MNITGVSNNTSLAPVNRQAQAQAQAQETNGTFGGRTVQIGKAVGRVLLGIVTLGVSEIVRALRSRSTRQEATQPRDKRVQNHGTVPRPNTANANNIWLAGQFSETGLETGTFDLNPMSFDKVFSDGKMDEGFEGEMDTRRLRSDIRNAILKSEKALNLFEAKEIAQQKIKQFFSGIKEMHNTIDKRDDLDPSRKQEMKQLVLKNTDPKFFLGQAITPKRLKSAIDTYKSKLLESELPKLLGEGAHKFGLENRLEEMGKKNLMKKIGGLGAFGKTPPTLIQMKARAQEKIQQFMAGKKKILDHIDIHKDLSGKERQVLKDMALRREEINSTTYIDQIVTGKQTVIDYVTALSKNPPDTAKLLDCMDALLKKIDHAKNLLFPKTPAGAEEKSNIGTNFLEFAFKSSFQEKNNLQRAHQFLSGKQGGEMKQAFTTLLRKFIDSKETDLNTYFSSLLRLLRDANSVLNDELNVDIKKAGPPVKSTRELPEAIVKFAEAKGISFK